MIAHARHDENGNYSGGQAGDQTGEEVAITEWYNRPWQYVLRAPYTPKRWKIADYAEQIAGMENVGYDQGGRRSLYDRLKEHGFDLSKVTENCEVDCSSLVAVCCILSGYNVSPDIYTGNERVALQTLGFQALQGDYVKSPDHLLKGDILLYEKHHTAINLTDGKYAVLYPILGWYKDYNKGWYYADTHTTYLHDRWALINQYWYYFDSEGYMLTGLQKIKGKLYYLNEKDNLQGALCETNDNGALVPWKVI